MDIINTVGSIAASLTTLAFVPQVIQVVKTKSTKDISLPMFVLFSIGVSLWLAYGLLLLAIPIIVANIVVLVLALTILFYKIKYK